MIKEILQYKNIGTPNYLIKVLQYANKKTLSQKDLQDLFFKESIDGRHIFDGGIKFLLFINVLKLDNNKILINNSFLHFLENEDLLIKKINKMFLSELKEDVEFKIIFNGSSVLYDENDNLIVSNSAFKFKYPVIRQFLLDFKIIDKHPYINNNFIVNEQYKKYFRHVPVSLDVNKKSLTLEELKRRQEIQNQYGENAERFVVDYEKSKFKSHELVEAIEMISDLNVGAGYDVVSLISDDSNRIDKFIEVKSYQGKKPYFYWSKNEVRKANEIQENYFLYLVNRDEIDSKEYSPVMISNPYSEVFDSLDWKNECEKWYFTKN